MKITVVGAGAWGTAVATHAAQQHEVSLWARTADEAQPILAYGENQRYLPGIPLPAMHIRSGTPQPTDVAEQDLVIIATPVAGLRHQLQALRSSQVPVVWLCKGFEQAQAGETDGLLPHEVMQQVAPDLQAGVLSGPSFALEVARQQPTALVAASPSQLVRDRAVAAMHGGNMRVYSSADTIGVEVGGAVKNVLAIAAGVLDGLAARADNPLGMPGLNARAALLTRGLAEMTRLGVRLGAQASTFMGLSGMGDLVLTATGDLSRNRRVGLLLAEGLTAQQAADSLGHVAEGVYCARTVLARAQHLGVDMPITRGVVALLDGNMTAMQAARQLLERDARSEQD